MPATGFYENSGLSADFLETSRRGKTLERKHTAEISIREMRIRRARHKKRQLLLIMLMIFANDPRRDLRGAFVGQHTRMLLRLVCAKFGK